MSDTLRNQLENLAQDLPVIDTSHFVMLQKTDTGPVAFLFEKRIPKGEEPSLHMLMTVQPEFQNRLFASRNKKLVQRASRTRYKFSFRTPKRDVALPAEVQCPKKAKWLKIADRLYDRLKAHDSKAWEDLLGELLDVPSRGRSAGRG